MRMRNLLVLLVCVLICFSFAYSQTVVQKIRLSNTTEASTYIATGPYAHSFAIADGYTVKVFPAAASANSGGAAGPRDLFDTRAFATGNPPRGLTYIESEHLFALSDVAQPFIYIVDHKGTIVQTLTIPYDSFVPENAEGLLWIPENSPVFPGRFLLVANSTAAGSRIMVLKRDGSIDGQILLDEYEGYFTGIAFIAPDKLLLGGANDDQVRILNLNGNEVGPRISTGYTDIEGITLLPNNRLAMVSGTGGTVLMYDMAFNRLPNLDRNFRTGPGIYQLRGVTWDSARDRYVTIGTRVAPYPEQLGIYAVNLEGTTVTRLADLNPQPDVINYTYLNYGFPIYMPGYDRTAVTRLQSPRLLMQFDSTGQLVDTMQYVGANGFGTFAPTSETFFFRRGASSTFAVFDMVGNQLPDLDLSGTGLTTPMAIAYFDPTHPSGGRLLLFEAQVYERRAVVTDMNGNVISSFNYLEKLGVTNPFGAAQITSGPLAGKFVVLDRNVNDLVIFSLE